MTTPIRRQYLDVKRRFPHAIVFFRLGDFYETFDEDARLVARELDITLTSKPMGRSLRVPLAGVPRHSLETHLRKLVGRGYKVAICEQMEDPRSAKGIVQRDVVRVVSPGTVIEESLLAPAASSYLVALAPGARVRGQPPSWGLACIDLAAAEFAVAVLAEDELGTELARLDPAEVLLPDGVEPPLPVSAPRTSQDPRCFDVDEAGRLLRSHFAVASLDAFGLRSLDAGVCAAGAGLSYVLENQRAAAANLRSLRVYNPGGYLVLDASARRHLELFSSVRDGSRAGSLIDAIDATRTAMGSRLLARWLGQPLLDINAINRRLDGVEAFVSDGLHRARVRDLLRQVPDIERIVARIVAGMATPRDLGGLRRGLEVLPEVLESRVTPEGDSLAGALAAGQEAVALLRAAIADEPAPAIGEGGVIRAGFSDDLDEARTLTGDARRALAEMESAERERTGIRSLRVAYNRVFGYYIEVSKANLALVPDDYHRKQTLVGGERFVTPALKDLEEKVLHAREAIGELEASLFARVCAQLGGLSEVLRTLAAAAAETDVLSAFAETAARHGFVRPVVDEGEAVVIRGGRHPVVERALGEGRFVPNDTDLDSSDAQIVVLTGPNMAGKSTYLRQVALLVILAQAGSFVPAASARIGVVDRVFTRIGAQDDVGRGESTFMIEMLETASVLHNATRRSLVLFDEVGRGTSTYDGIAIARAVVEHLHAGPESAAKTLFATHYHEMTSLAETLPRVRNYCVAVTEQDGRVVFLHRIVPGGADRSYGIYVAELAGMPAGVVQRAREVLQGLEAVRDGRTAKHSREPAAQMSLLAGPSEVESALGALDLDGLTPLQALTKLYELRAKVRGSDERR